MNEAFFFHLLNLIPGCGAKTIREAVAHFGSAQVAWEAGESEWRHIASRFNPAGLDAKRRTIDLKEEEQKLEASDIDIIPFTDSNFPALLQEIQGPPALLYARGPWRAWDNTPCIAIVGSRDYSPYGQQATEELSRALAEAGLIIVSGLAFGIDSLAHRGALSAGTPTVAVLGSGIDDPGIAPQSHLSLAHAILDQGVILSEYAPGTQPAAGTFPARNRIIAGMTLGTLIIEAKEGSGSLITARLALDFNREVLVVPGSIFSPLSVGTNALLKQGATPVTGVQDILNALQLEAVPAQRGEKTDRPIELTEEEQKIMVCLSRDGLFIDKVIEFSRLETTQATSLLTRLEMRGLVKNIGNMHYIKL